VVVVHAQDGARHELEAKEGRALMWQLRALRVGVVGLCSGNAACGTCHVYVDPAWFDRLPPIEDYEDEMLAELSHRTDCSRLSCQIEYSAELDGLRLTVAPRD